MTKTKKGYKEDGHTRASRKRGARSSSDETEHDCGDYRHPQPPLIPHGRSSITLELEEGGAPIRWVMAARASDFLELFNNLAFEVAYNRDGPPKLYEELSIIGVDHDAVIRNILGGAIPVSEADSTTTIERKVKAYVHREIMERDIGLKHQRVLDRAYERGKKAGHRPPGGVGAMAGWFCKVRRILGKSGTLPIWVFSMLFDVKVETVKRGMREWLRYIAEHSDPPIL